MLESPQHPTTFSGPVPVRNTHPVAGGFFALVVLFLSGLLVFRGYGFSAETVGYWIGTLIIPSLIAYAIAGAVKRRNWLAYSGWLLVLFLMFNGFNRHTTLMGMSKTQQIRQLSGTAPENPNLIGRDREVANMSRAVFAQLRVFSQSQESRRKALETGLAQVNTPASFADRKHIDTAVNTLTETDKLDDEMAAEIEGVPILVRAEAAKTNLSESDQAQAIRGFVDSYQKSIRDEGLEAMLSTKKQWIEANTVLYQYALAHLSTVRAKDDKILITNDMVRRGFNSRLETSNKLDETFLAAADRFKKAHAEHLQKQGVTAADIGLN